MTIRVISAIGLLTVFSSCTEIGPSIDFGTAFTEDTTYVTSVESPQLKNTLIEEFTGVSCPPCPSGHEIVRSIKSQHTGRVIVIAYHILNFPQAEPIHNVSKQDFRTQDATDVGNSIFNGIGAMPVAGIDRVLINSSPVITKGVWPSTVTQQMAQITPINIFLSRMYNDASREVVLTVKVSFTAVVAKKLAVNIAIVEDSIIDAQKNQLAIDTFYTHNYVLRDLITPINGNPFLDDISSKEPGRVYERKFVFPVDSNWVASRCKIVAFVNANEPDDKEVKQAVIIDLME